MNDTFISRLEKDLEEIKSAGLYKTERIIDSPQGAEIQVLGNMVLNFCANNYLGLSSHPKVLEAAKKTIDTRGYGMSSVRFICGTQDIHRELEHAEHGAVRKPGGAARPCICHPPAALGEELPAGSPG